MKKQYLIGLSIHEWKERHKAQKRREHVLGLFIAFPALSAIVYTFFKNL